MAGIQKVSVIFLRVKSVDLEYAASIQNMRPQSIAQWNNYIGHDTQYGVQLTLQNINACVYLGASITEY